MPPIALARVMACLAMRSFSTLGGCVPPDPKDKERRVTLASTVASSPSHHRIALVMWDSVAQYAGRATRSELYQ